MFWTGSVFITLSILHHRLAAISGDNSVIMCHTNDIDPYSTLVAMSCDYPNVIEHLSLDNFFLNEKCATLLFKIIKTNKQVRTLNLEKYLF